MNYHDKNPHHLTGNPNRDVKPLHHAEIEVLSMCMPPF